MIEAGPDGEARVVQRLLSAHPGISKRQATLKLHEIAVKRRAHDRVAQDAGLAEELATELARALQLPGTNRTLGRTFVRYGLAALREPTEERAEQAFLAKAKSLASIRPELASQLLHRVRERLRNATLQLAAKRDEAAAAARGGAGAPILGFSRATAETLRSTASNKAGGLVQGARERR